MRQMFVRLSPLCLLIAVLGCGHTSQCCCCSACNGTDGFSGGGVEESEPMDPGPLSAGPLSTGPIFAGPEGPQGTDLSPGEAEPVLPMPRALPKGSEAADQPNGVQPMGFEVQWAE